MFADAALAARIDRMEARLCARLVMAAPEHPSGGPFVLPLDGGLALFAAPRSPMNKVIGFGFDAELDLQELATIEERWAERGEPVRIELSILADPAVVAKLSERGYRLQGFENVLACRIARAAQAAAPSPEITIEIVGGDTFEEWFTIAIDSFSNMDGSGSASDPVLPREELERLLREAMGPQAVEGLTRYIARFGGEPAGEAALHIDEGLALLSGSGTVPHLRGRGVQKALVARRLDDARCEGCDLAVVVTAPGTRSQENVMRRGFELLYTRAVLVRPLEQLIVDERRPR
jgi:GNAT superfamily N-acetyltransferase